MKNNLLLIFMFITIFMTSQENKIDTLTDDNLQIVLDSEVEKILNTKENFCKLTNKKNIENIIKRTEEDSRRTEIIRTNRELDVCFDRDKVDGIKIKVGILKTIEDANKLKREVMTQFPYITTPEIKDVRPHYYVLIGDYFSRKAAAKQFSEVKKKYPDAVLTPWRVYCRKAIPNGK